MRAANNADATTYLTEAQDAYKDAYADYGAGNCRRSHEESPEERSFVEVFCSALS